MKISSKTRRVLNKYLSQIGYSATLPFSAISEKFNESSVRVIDFDDGVILCGDNGRCTFDLSLNGILVDNAMLVFHWHKMNSGMYEIVAYVS